MQATGRPACCKWTRAHMLPALGDRVVVVGGTNMQLQDHLEDLAYPHEMQLRLFDNASELNNLQVWLMHVRSHVHVVWHHLQMSRVWHFAGDMSHRARDCSCDTRHQRLQLCTIQADRTIAALCLSLLYLHDMCKAFADMTSA